jgi:hypothetical protein
VQGSQFIAAAGFGDCKHQAQLLDQIVQHCDSSVTGGFVCEQHDEVSLFTHTSQTQCIAATSTLNLLVAEFTSHSSDRTTSHFTCSPG